MPRLAYRPADPTRNWDALQQALGPARAALLRAVRAQAAAQGWPVYVVGGFVRDWLLGHLSLDLDLVVEGPAARLARALAARLGGRVTEHRAFGTATWWLPPAVQLNAALGLARAEIAVLPPFLDFATARRETYPRPAALPQVQPADLHADLHRRDFTINAMAVGLHPHPGRFYDPFHGLEDLQQGVLRVLHARSFRDDPTRLFRAVRYAVRYRLRLSPETEAQWPQGLAYIPALSGDRVRHELDRILDEPRAPRMVRALGRRGVATAVHPRLPTGPAAARRLRRGVGAAARDLAAAWGLGPEVPRATRYGLWWATLGRTARNEVLQRLLAPGRLQEVVHGTARLWRRRRAWASLGPAALTFLLERYPLEAVLAVRLLSDDPAQQARLDRFARVWRHCRPHTTGHHLQARGVPPGPLYGQVLRALRAARIEGRVRTPDDEARLLDALLATLQAVGEPGGRDGRGTIPA